MAAIMEARNLSQQQVAEATGIEPGVISKLWRGIKHKLEEDHRNKLCRVLDCTLADLLDSVPGEKPMTTDDGTGVPSAATKGSTSAHLADPTE